MRSIPERESTIKCNQAAPSGSRRAFRITQMQSTGKAHHPIPVGREPLKENPGATPNGREYLQSAVIRTAMTLVVTLTLAGIVDGSSWNDLDEFGNLEPWSMTARLDAPAHQTKALGDVLYSFGEPVSIFDLTFFGASLWGANKLDGIVEMDPDTGALRSTVTISPPTTASAGLGFDTVRHLFIVTDVITDTISTVDPDSGAVMNSFSTPGSGPVGASYDSLRDGYWIADASTDTLDLVDPSTGSTLASCDATAVGASRIAGVAHAPFDDRLVFNSRDTAVTHVINAGDCSFVASFPTPPTPGLNNGTGITIRPTDGVLYVLNSDIDIIYAVDSAGWVMGNQVFCDDFESGGTSAWSNESP